MLSSITPVGEVARHQRWGITATAYVGGSILGGTVTGAVLGGVGAPTADVLGTAGSLALLAAVAAIGLAADLAPVRLPTWRRQVDERWLGTYRGWAYGGGFGFQLGLGWATTVPRSATYVLLTAILLSGSLLHGMVLGAAFGLGRAAPLLVTRRVRTPRALRRLHRRLERWRLPVDRLTRVGQGAVGVAAAAMALR